MYVRSLVYTRRQEILLHFVDVILHLHDRFCPFVRLLDHFLNWLLVRHLRSQIDIHIFQGQWQPHRHNYRNHRHRHNQATCMPYFPCVELDVSHDLSYVSITDVHRPRHTQNQNTHTTNVDRRLSPAIDAGRGEGVIHPRFLGHRYVVFDVRTCTIACPCAHYLRVSSCTVVFHTSTLVIRRVSVTVPSSLYLVYEIAIFVSTFIDVDEYTYNIFYYYHPRAI